MPKAEDTLRRAVGMAGATLVAASLAGGVASVIAGANTWADAWTAQATLAAPWPMLMVQTAATLAAAQRKRIPAMIGSGLLALSSAVAGVSGFFDGQLGRRDLGTWHVAGQICYVLIAWATATISAIRLWRLWRR